MIDRKARNRQALDRLREQRAPQLAAARARLKEQVKIVGAITSALKEAPRSVPALAEATGLPTETVFWHLMALKKYGEVVEGDQEGDYYQYRLK